MRACPHCGRLTIPAWRVLLGGTVKCGSCGGLARAGISSRRGIAVLIAVSTVLLGTLIYEFGQQSFWPVLFFACLFAVAMKYYFARAMPLLVAQRGPQNVRALTVRLGSMLLQLLAFWVWVYLIVRAAAYLRGLSA